MTVPTVVHRRELNDERPARDPLAPPEFPEVRAACACGWSGGWVPGDEGADVEWYAHTDPVGYHLYVHEPRPSPRSSGESTRAFMQRTDPVGYQHCRDAGRF